MKRIQVAEDIVPLAKFKARASEVFRQLRREQRPVVITQNGKPAGVLVSPEEFDRLQEHDRFLEAVREGLADSEQGRLTDDEELTAELESDLGDHE